jgi:cytochrome c oxidase subunit II
VLRFESSSTEKHLDLTRGIQSSLNSQGPHAEAVAGLAWILFYGAAFVFVLVAVFAAVALWAPDARRRWMSGNGFVVYGGIVFPSVVLTALFLYSLSLARAIAPSGPSPALRIEIIGHQWWWRVHYLDADGRIDFATANELRLPAGRPVELILKSADVIHSFWVPNLAGKLDMIPGHVNRLRVTAAREGVFRGQCAEYCGGPHAKMALYVVGLASQDFERWLETQRAAAAEPREPQSDRGRTVFLERCAVCHTVRGTLARGELGPDLTHVGSRASLGAGILPNDRTNIAAWISASQQIKPGNLMPSMNVFGAEDLNALAAYVESLR